MGWLAGRCNKGPPGSSRKQPHPIHSILVAHGTQGSPGRFAPVPLLVFSTAPACLCLQVFDPETFRPKTVHKYSVPILSLAASPAANVLAVGMADGTLSVHRRRQQEAAPAPERLR